MQLMKKAKLPNVIECTKHVICRKFNYLMIQYRVYDATFHEEIGEEETKSSVNETVFR